MQCLKILNLSRTRVSEVPETISKLSCLQRLELLACHQIQKLPTLPISLTHLQLESALLRVVPDLSNLTNLVELYLDDGGERGKYCTGGFSWIERLSKLTKLSLRLDNVRSAIHMETFPQLPSSLQNLGLSDIRLIESLCPNMRNLLHLDLSRIQRQVFEFDGLQLPLLRELSVQECFTLKRLRLSSMRKLKGVRVSLCSSLDRIQFPWVFDSLEALSIGGCKSLKWIVYVKETGQDNSEYANELITSEARVILPSRALNKLQSFMLSNCRQIHEIQIVGTFEVLECFEVHDCPSLESLGGLSNSKNLRHLCIGENNALRDIEGLKCGSSESLIDVLSTKLPIHCHIKIFGGRKIFEGTLESCKHQVQKQRRRLSFNSFLHCILPCFFRLD